MTIEGIEFDEIKLPRPHTSQTGGVNPRAYRPRKPRDIYSVHVGWHPSKSVGGIDWNRSIDLIDREHGYIVVTEEPAQA